MTKAKEDDKSISHIPKSCYPFVLVNPSLPGRSRGHRSAWATFLDSLSPELVIPDTLLLVSPLFQKGAGVFGHFPREVRFVETKSYKTSGSFHSKL